MHRDITIQARWDGEACVWLATSEDVPGLVVEAETWPAMIDEARLVLPELLDVSGQGATGSPSHSRPNSISILPALDG